MTLTFTDETLRNGPQSLWATRMSTRAMLDAARFLAPIGVARATVLSGASAETAVRFLRDDPWERLRLMRDCLPGTPLEVLIRSRNLFGWSRYSDDVVELLLKCLKRNGAQCVKVFDGLNDVGAIAAHCRLARALDLRVAGMITLSISPIHDEAHFARKAGEFARLGVDAIVLVDASGIMDGPRTHRIVTAVRATVGDGMPIEFYAHCSMGLAQESYRAAVEAGVDAVTTTAAPLANGDSMPSTLEVAGIATELGVPVQLDARAAAAFDDFMEWVTVREGFQPGARRDFDPIAYRRFVEHQIPGGMISNFRRQLREAGLGERIDEVLAEAGRVRAELGYPVMVTPFSQFVGVQATLNIIQGERYRTVPNEVRLYAQGYYGESGAPIDPNVLDRIFDGRSVERIVPETLYESPLLPEFRREHGPFASDEALLLALFYGKPAAASLAAHKSDYAAMPVVDTPIVTLVRELLRERSIRSFSLERGAAHEAAVPALKMKLSTRNEP